MPNCFSHSGINFDTPSTIFQTITPSEPFVRRPGQDFPNFITLFLISIVGSRFGPGGSLLKKISVSSAHPRTNFAFAVGLKQVVFGERALDVDFGVIGSRDGGAFLDLVPTTPSPWRGSGAVAEGRFRGSEEERFSDVPFFLSFRAFSAESCRLSLVRDSQATLLRRCRNAFGSPRSSTLLIRRFFPGRPVEVGSELERDSSGRFPSRKFRKLVSRRRDSEGLSGASCRRDLGMLLLCISLLSSSSSSLSSSSSSKSSPLQVITGRL